MEIYQHFRPEEKVFIDQVLQWKENVEMQYAPKLTSFLDPREQQILSILIGKNDDCRIAFFGGWSEAERKRALLYPSYYEPGQKDFDIALLEIKYNSKFNEINHRQVLGTFMSLGLAREKFGDVVLAGERAQIAVADEISGYAIANVSKIGPAGVKLERQNFDKLLAPENTWQNARITCNSLRLDNLLSTIGQISRKKAQDFIEAKKVKVNHAVAEKNDFVCEEGDLLSVRGLGRFRIIALSGKSKKDKWIIEYGKQKK